MARLIATETARLRLAFEEELAPLRHLQVHNVPFRTVATIQPSDMGIMKLVQALPVFDGKINEYAAWRNRPVTAMSMFTNGNNQGAK